MNKNQIKICFFFLLFCISGFYFIRGDANQLITIGWHSIWSYFQHFFNAHFLISELFIFALCLIILGPKNEFEF